MTSDDKFFTYDALNSLHVDIDNVLSYIHVDEVIIVPFKINFNSTQPFNTFLLMNDFTDILNFPSVNITYKNDSYDSQEILSRIKLYLYSILISNNNSDVLNYDLETFMNTVDFKGLHVYENKVYAFVDLTKLEINTNLVNRNSLYWFSLIDEIVNKNKVCDIRISDEVSDFFMNNNKFIFFKNSKEEQIEIPSVVYSGTSEKSLHFNFTFGNRASDNNAILSSGFYFTDYTNAFRQGGWSSDYKSEFKYGEKITEDDDDDNESGKYTKGGIIRYALFLGNNLVKMNYPNDTIDESEIKKVKLINAENIENNEHYVYEKMTLRISDHDGLWKQNYDSVYLGKMELDNGEYLRDAPLYVVKDYYNHTPLSYHYINKRTLGSKFDENSDYQIM
jgi:hypothetical protein